MNQTNDRNSQNDPRRENIRMVIWVICGFYLLYLAYGLVRSILTGEADTTVDRIVCIVGGAVFIVAGILLVVRSVRYGIRYFKEVSDAMDRPDEEDPAEDQDWPDDDELPAGDAEPPEDQDARD